MCGQLFNQLQYLKQHQLLHDPIFVKLQKKKEVLFLSYLKASGIIYDDNVYVDHRCTKVDDESLASGKALAYVDAVEYAASTELCIELDEHQHKGYSGGFSCEIARMVDIDFSARKGAASAAGGGNPERARDFIRFNGFDEYFDSTALIKGCRDSDKSRKTVLDARFPAFLALRDKCEREEDKEKKLFARLRVHYLFYELAQDQPEDKTQRRRLAIEDEEGFQMAFSALIGHVVV